MNHSAAKEEIERIVREEIRDMVSAIKDMVQKEVRAQLIPEMRGAIRSLIPEALEKMKDKSSLIAKPADTPKIAKAESSEKLPMGAVSRGKVRTQEATSKPVAPPEADTRGKYLYCVAKGNKVKSLGRIGIEGARVYTIPYKDLSAVVHNSPAEPYRSEDKEVVENWVTTHQRVLDVAAQEFATILPSGFDTIIRDDGGADSEENVRKWLEEDYENLKHKMEKVRGRAEYGVQIFWDPEVIGDKAIRNNEEIKKLKEEVKSKSKGTAYMYKHKIEKTLKKEMEKEADRHFKSFYERIRKCVSDLKVEKTKKDEANRQMLLNISCLASRNGYEDLGEELERIDKMHGFSVRFTGPWPPYSFVS